MKPIQSAMILFLALLGITAFADEPELPAGLGQDEPSLPSGLGSQEPILPDGLSEDEPALPNFGSNLFSEEKSHDESLAQQLGITGFSEFRAGIRTRNPVEQRNTSLAELRLSVEKEFQVAGWQAKLAVNALYDDVADSQAIDLESGDGWLDLREAWAFRRLGGAFRDNADIKLGRQILTWGVGDLLFINDLFPKDWNSFLAGRNEQYLKAPSDALRFGFYSQVVNINLVYTPRFDSDRYIDGKRLSYFNPMSSEVVGRNGIVLVDKPENTGQDDELAVRLYHALGSFEVALYGYDGFWKSPGGFDPVTELAIFPELRVYGASARGPIGPGIVSIELGYYDSRDDTSGNNPWVNNSEMRYLLGYEWEVALDTTLGLQFYAEQLQDYSAYRASLFPAQPVRDEDRQVFTFRLTRLAMNQNLTLSLFGFYSPTDKDAYLRPAVSYKITDNWLVEGGLNVFIGDKPNTFFGQFESNSNGYLSVRYSFN